MFEALDSTPSTPKGEERTDPGRQAESGREKRLYSEAWERSVGGRTGEQNRMMWGRVGAGGLAEAAGAFVARGSS